MEEEVVEEEVVAEEVVKELLKALQLLLSIKDPEEEVLVEEEDIEKLHKFTQEEEEVGELLKFTEEEGVMGEIPKALVHQWRRHSYHRLKTL